MLNASLVTIKSPVRSELIDQIIKIIAFLAVI